jgi:molybdate transport system substrate-binding protein
MSKFTMVIALLLVVVGGVPTTVYPAEEVVLASGAGYRKMADALNTAYEANSGNKLRLVYGNMARVSALARQSGQVDLVLGDEFFLVHTADLRFQKTRKLGRGRLVLAFARSSKFSRVADLDNDQVGRIALPDTKRAIYGKAAREFFQNTGRLPAIEPRLVEVATVPQVFAYLATDEVDMGFINLTLALAVKNKLGGYVVIDETRHAPIRILVGVLAQSEHQKEVADFLDFLETPGARTIIREHGL